MFWVVGGGIVRMRKRCVTSQSLWRAFKLRSPPASLIYCFQTLLSIYLNVLISRGKIHRTIGREVTRARDNELVETTQVLLRQAGGIVSGKSWRSRRIASFCFATKRRPGMAEWYAFKTHESLVIVTWFASTFSQKFEEKIAYVRFLFQSLFDLLVLGRNTRRVFLEERTGLGQRGQASWGSPCRSSSPTRSGQIKLSKSFRFSTKNVKYIKAIHYDMKGGSKYSGGIGPVVLQM